MTQKITLISFCSLLLLALSACARSGGGHPAPDWQINLPDSKYGTLALSDGFAFLMTNSSNSIENTAQTLSAIDLKNGHQIWQQPINQSLESGWYAAAGRVVYVIPGQSAQIVVALESNSGREAWRFEQMKLDDGLLLRGNVLYLHNTQNNVLCLNAADGHTLATFPSEVPAAEMNGQEKNTLLLSYTESDYSILTPTGVLHNYSVNSAGETISLQLQFNGTPHGLEIAGSRAYVSTRDDQQVESTYVFDLPSGKQLWNAQAAHGLWQEASGTFGQIAFLYENGGLAAYNINNGTRLYTITDSLNQISTDANPQFIGIKDGEFHLYDIASGKLLWSAKTGDKMAISLGAKNGVAYSLSGSQDWGGSAYATALDIYDLSAQKSLWRWKRGVSEVRFIGDQILIQMGGELNLLPLRP